MFNIDSIGVFETRHNPLLLQRQARRDCITPFQSPKLPNYPSRFSPHSYLIPGPELRTCICNHAIPFGHKFRIQYSCSSLLFCYLGTQTISCNYLLATNIHSKPDRYHITPWAYTSLYTRTCMQSYTSSHLDQASQSSPVPHKSSAHTRYSAKLTSKTKKAYIMNSNPYYIPRQVPSNKYQHRRLNLPFSTSNQRSLRHDPKQHKLSHLHGPSSLPIQVVGR